VAGEKLTVPRTIPLLLMLAGVVVALRHVARPVLLMLVLPGADVDHVPSVSGVSGQLPLTVETAANCMVGDGALRRYDSGDGTAIPRSAAAAGTQDANESHSQKQQ
jgi:hypothetical protein